jgi:hypothetical protein
MVESVDSGSAKKSTLFSNADERAAIEHRRAAIFADNKEPLAVWGLAFSGGGIRSATFCLGVLQALAKAKFSPAEGAPVKTMTPLLARFDYLSTVSGGGYAGSFYSALFRPRPNQPFDEHIAAEAAYAALDTDPPGRMGTVASQNIVDRPLRWLRENGRYLAPNNTGDLLLDVAIAIRNLCAVHYVIGITLLTLFLFMFVFRYVTVSLPFNSQASIIAIEKLTQPACASCHGSIWWSPWFVMTSVWMVVGLAPFGVAYWLGQAKPAKWWSALFCPSVTAAILLIGGAYISTTLPPPSEDGVAFMMLLFNVILLIALIEYVIVSAITMVLYNGAVRIFRAKITRYLANALILAIGLALMATIETAGQTLYLWLLTAKSKPTSVYTIVAAVVATVAAVRQFAPVLAQPRDTGLLAKLPLNAILGAVGVVLMLLLAVAWDCVATALFFRGAIPTAASNQTLIASAFELSKLNGIPFWKIVTFYPWAMIAFCIGATVAAGYFLGFINLSSLQMLYSARLTRAYLGASNKARFDENKTKQDVTEPHKDDDFSRSDYYKNNHLGPAHIINVTINATTGSGDQLTQRDRQGIPMAITPAGVIVNGELWKKGVELSIGQWVGISGAAFSTGIGRGTGLGTALVFGLTNVRLGWWWESGGKQSAFIKWPWRNQAYLARELRARFVGRDGLHWYLSDGGHYENTGVLELLRRRVGFVVCCDCGADPHYTFDDLANLMRLARIDFGAEFALIPPSKAPPLATRPANIDEFFARDESELSMKPQGTDNKCALLYRVTYATSDAGEPTETFLMVIKPRLIKDAPLDLFEYQSKHPDFPQQATFDQFFDEAQWESYRKLGVMIGSRIFS